MVSFSFTIGTKSSLNKLSKVLFALRALLLCSVSSRVRRIWEILIFNLTNVYENKFISSFCPIEAKA